MESDATSAVPLSSRLSDSSTSWYCANAYKNQKCWILNNLKTKTLKNRVASMYTLLVPYRFLKNASSGNRTRVTPMATVYSTTRPTMLMSAIPNLFVFLFIKGVAGCSCRACVLLSWRYRSYGSRWHRMVTFFFNEHKKNYLFMRSSKKTKEKNNRSTSYSQYFGEQHSINDQKNLYPIFFINTFNYYILISFFQIF